jgi:hypothetical protein
MRRLVAAAALVLVTSCGPAASATATPKSSVSSPTPASTPAGSGLPTARIHCRLPIGNGRSIGGFITYPEGTFTPDPTSDPATIAYLGPNSSSISWSFPPTYDWPAARWLPIPRPLLAPDGAAYAYAEQVYAPVGPTPVNGPGPGPIGTRVHVVEVATNKNRILIDGPTFWSVVAYRNHVVYMIHPCYEGCGADSGGLWTLDPATGAIQQIVAPDPDPFNPSAGISQHLWTLIGSDAAWAGDPKSGGLARLDLAARSVTIWFTVAAKSLDPAGLDQVGHPIVRGEPNYSVPGSTGGGAWIVTAPGVATRIASDDRFVTGAIADNHGIWLTGAGSLYLVTADSQTSDVGGLPAGTERNVAGPCA